MLEWRHVLVFIHQKDAVLGSNLFRNAGFALQHSQRCEKDVLKVDAALFILDLFVALMNAGDYFQRQTPGETLSQSRALVAIVIECVGLDLPPLDISRQITNDGRVHRERQLIQGFGNERSLRGGDVGQSAPRDARPKMLHLAKRGGVKSSRGNAGDTECAQALSHL